MKSPAELKSILRRQWENATRRTDRLTGAAGAWPIVLSIGRPTPTMLRDELDFVKRHIETWRKVGVGEVVWETIRYRSTAAAVDIPVLWKLRRPSQWIEACADSAMRQEFELLTKLVEQTDAAFHSSFIRRRSLWLDKPVNEIVQAARLASSLSPGCALGRPLRMLAMEGIDTKFFERHGQLITQLLDLRFDGEVSSIGLENFLGALTTTDHWLLVVDLDGSLLPFKKVRVNSAELRDTALPGERLLIVENETCQHQLPAVPNGVAVLGAGFDLSWAEGSWLSAKQVAYWGDIDTWGLQFLAKARRNIEHLDALMMTEQIFEQFFDSAVAEPVVADSEVPSGLLESEQRLYRRLLSETRGRLEQEYLPTELSCQTIANWANRCTE